MTGLVSAATGISSASPVSPSVPGGQAASFTGDMSVRLPVCVFDHSLGVPATHGAASSNDLVPRSIPHAGPRGMEAWC